MFKPCTVCGEPGIIDGCCYDHAKACVVCDEPHNNEGNMCDCCLKQRETTITIQTMAPEKYFPAILSKVRLSIKSGNTHGYSGVYNKRKCIYPYIYEYHSN